MKAKKTKVKYFMESDSENERLITKTDVDTAMKQLKLIGLSKGMSVADIGCGPGIIASEIAKLVYPANVTAIDQSDTRLQYAKKEFLNKVNSNLKFKKSNCYKLELEDSQFDLVWSRFLFEYLEEPLDALSEMKRVCRVGGKVVVADLDQNCLAHYPLPKKIEKQLNKVIGIISLKTGFDPFVGRKLYTYFKKMNFINIKVHAGYHHLISGATSEHELKNWKQKLYMVKPFWKEIFSSLAEYEDFVNEMIKILTQEDRFTYSSLFIVEGVKSE